MKIKHKVVKEFQYLTPDKKIFILKVGTILDEYIYKVKNESINIDKDIIDNNPDFFSEYKGTFNDSETPAVAYVFGTSYDDTDSYWYKNIHKKY